jgi:hypothetical protein
MQRPATSTSNLYLKNRDFKSNASFALKHENSSIAAGAWQGMNAGTLAPASDLYSTANGLIRFLGLFLDGKELAPAKSRAFTGDPRPYYRRRWKRASRGCQDLAMLHSLPGRFRAEWINDWHAMGGREDTPHNDPAIAFQREEVAVRNPVGLDDDPSAGPCATDNSSAGGMDLYVVDRGGFIKNFHLVRKIAIAGIGIM